MLGQSQQFLPNFYLPEPVTWNLFTKHDFHVSTAANERTKLVERTFYVSVRDGVKIGTITIFEKKTDTAKFTAWGCRFTDQRIAHEMSHHSRLN